MQEPSKRAKQDNDIAYLPLWGRDVWLLISTYLANADVLSLRGVCSQLCSLLSTSHVWQGRVAKLVGASAPVMQIHLPPVSALERGFFSLYLAINRRHEGRDLTRVLAMASAVETFGDESAASFQCVVEALGELLDEQPMEKLELPANASEALRQLCADRCASFTGTDLNESVRTLVVLASSTVLSQWSRSLGCDEMSNDLTVVRASDGLRWSIWFADSCLFECGASDEELLELWCDIPAKDQKSHAWSRSL